MCLHWMQVRRRFAKPHSDLDGNAARRTLESIRKRGRILHENMRISFVNMNMKEIYN